MMMMSPKSAMGKTLLFCSTLWPVSVVSLNGIPSELFLCSSAITQRIVHLRHFNISLFIYLNFENL